MAGFPPRIGVAFLVVAFACVSGAPKALAASDDPVPCTNRDTSAVFARWLDPAQYFLASNGGFEQAADGWKLRGDAAVVPGNESFAVRDASDANSLSLGSGGSAEMHTACVGLLEPTVRLFVKAPRVLGARLRIEATVVNPTTGLAVQTNYVVLGGLAPAGWAPTAPILIPNLVGGMLAQELTLRITAEGAKATWGVDDVYVDPFRQR
jgi:hypothetical protein